MWCQLRHSHRNRRSTFTKSLGCAFSTTTTHRAQAARQLSRSHTCVKLLRCCGHGATVDSLITHTHSERPGKWVPAKYGAEMILTMNKARLFANAKFSARSNLCDLSSKMHFMGYGL